jgi:hypothetical protein
MRKSRKARGLAGRRLRRIGDRHYARRVPLYRGVDAFDDDREHSTASASSRLRLPAMVK